MLSFLFIAGSLLSFITCISIGLFVFIKNRKSIVNRWFVAFNFFIGIWSGGIFFINIIPDPSVGLIIHRICYGGGVLLVPAFVHLVYGFRKKDGPKGIRIALYSVCLLLLVFLPTPFFIKTLITIKGTNLLQVSPGLIYYVYISYITVGVGYCLYMLLNSIRNSSGALKNQLKFVFAAYSIEYIGGGLYFSAVTGMINILPPSDYMVVLGSFILFYAIIKHHLMDIGLAWRYVSEYIIYLFLGIVVFVGSGFFFMKIFNPFWIALIYITLGLIITPVFRNLIRKISINMLLGKYKEIWDKLKFIANDKSLRYDMKDIMQIVLTDIPKLLCINNAIYYKLSESNNKFVSAQTDVDKESVLSEKNILSQRFEEQKIFIYKEYLAETEEDKKLKEYLNDHNIALCFPVFFNNNLVGIVCYGSKKDGSVFHKEDIKILADIIKNIQEQMANVLYLKYMSTSYAEQVLHKYKSTDQMQLLNAVKHLGAIRDLNGVSKQIVVLINRYLHSQYTHVYLYNEDQQGYVNQTENEIDFLPEVIKENHYLMKYLRQRKEVVLCTEIDKWAEESKSQDFREAAKLCKGLKATLIVPLIDVTLLGFIVLGERREKEEVYNTNSLMMLSFIADRAEITISNILVREKAERDELTGTHNKAYLNSRTRVEVANSLKEGIPLSYIMMDADDFKWFNDNHGYEAGNEVLKALVGAVEGVIRPTDEFCRWGGEELILLALGANKEGGAAAADKILETIRTDSKIQELTKRYSRKISISIGVACFDQKEPVDEFTNEDIRRISSALFMRSSKALKQAKKNGKDQAHESTPFKMGEEGEDRDIFPMKTLIVTENQEYSRMHIHGVDIDIKENIEEGLEVCRQYDIVIFDVNSKKDIALEGTIDMLKARSRELLVGIISDVKDREIAKKKGAEFFLSPMESKDLEKWTEYLKSKVL